MNHTIATLDDVKELAEKLCKKNGFKLLEMRDLPHPEDDYLKFVLAHDEKNKEYATWLLNVSSEGLNYGHYYNYRYDKTQEEAYNGVLYYYKNRV